MKLFVLFFFVFCGTCFPLHPDLKNSSFKLFGGSSCPELTQAIAHLLDIEVGKARVGKFNDGEIRIKIQESVRNSDVFILQSVCVSPGSTVNDNLMELFLMIRAMKRASVKSVTAVIPYYGYARQDRKSSSRVPVSASDVSMMIESAGADQVIAIDLHCGQIEGFFRDAPINDLAASTIFVPYIASLDLKDPVVISPDAGGVERAKSFVEKMHSHGISAKMAIIVKQRADAGVVDTMDLVGDVRGCDALIIDDICDTAGTLTHAARELKNFGARRVFACITHPLFSGPAIERITSSCIDKLIVTNTIPLRNPLPWNVEQLSIAPLLAEAIRRSAEGESLKTLSL